MSKEKTGFRQRFKETFRHKSSERRAASTHGKSRNSSLDMNETIVTEGRQALNGWPSKISDIAKHVPEGTPAANGLDLVRDLISSLADDLDSAPISTTSSATTQEVRALFGKMATARAHFDQQHQLVDSIVGNKSVAEKLKITVLINTEVKNMLDNVLELVLQAQLAHQVQPYLSAAQLYTSKIKHLEHEIRSLEESIESVNTPRVVNTYSGSGHQSIHNGSGTQNNNNGNGLFNHGPLSVSRDLHFGSSPQSAEPKPSP
ncbi:hypothetical protein GE21DRAFT_2655 [Neurospora crassa]|uniref:Uncharacterized protein n=2 Tax=Neurospora crassa TaxID=5141 RepID=Q1K8M8_NEUCR|nr:hypothetical protein NCU09612 [Neurospora crassa OR74A]EAA34140.1 hypothetical protein NCU09612 [Neurospora crassa OR74A]KHE79371.1 hypothetical protein GE21DRAFT_2655 [Neurospora crassa]CAB91397.1 related to H+-transporting ATP synthase chain b precursor [Neurospora crassa]|eukprot:XP_963376.1 hypothetical protein NCU09612 [Neurospora crassa OR74A]